MPKNVTPIRKNKVSAIRRTEHCPRTAHEETLEKTIKKCYHALLPCKESQKLKNYVITVCYKDNTRGHRQARTGQKEKKPWLK